MHRLPKVLVITAAVLFVMGSLRCLFAGSYLSAHVGGWLAWFSAETYWRGAVGLLMFAVTLLLMQRSQSDSGG